MAMLMAVSVVRVVGTEVGVANLTVVVDFLFPMESEREPAQPMTMKRFRHCKRRRMEIASVERNFVCHLNGMTFLQCFVSVLLFGVLGLRKNARMTMEVL